MPTSLPAIIVLCCALFIAPAFAANEDKFRAADDNLTAGEFESARDAFAKIVEERQFAPEVFFGLGNAHYRLEETGRAALAYRRALFLDPSFTEARQNLQFLTETQGLVDTATPAEENARRPLSARLLVTGIVFGGAMVLVGLCVLILSRERPRSIVTASVLAIVLGGTLSAGAAHFTFKRDAALPPADAVVIVGDGASARSAPAGSASKVISLPAGSMLRVDVVRGNWSYVDVPGSLKGWVDNDLLEKLWPYDPAYGG